MLCEPSPSTLHEQTERFLLRRGTFLRVSAVYEADLTAVEHSGMWQVGEIDVGKSRIVKVPPSWKTGSVAVVGQDADLTLGSELRPNLWDLLGRVARIRLENLAVDLGLIR